MNQVTSPGLVKEMATSPIQPEQTQMNIDSSLKEEKLTLGQKINQGLLSPKYELFMAIVTFIVLYADDIRMVTMTKHEDYLYYYFMVFCFLLFSTEMTLLSFVRPEYAFSFFFWMDLMSTISTAMDTPIIMSSMLGIDAFSTNKTTKLAKAGRASRVSTKATKLIRVVRLVRLVRVAKLYKYAYKGLENRLHSSETIIDYEKEFKDEDDKRIEFVMHTDQGENEVLLYNSKMVPKPRNVTSANVHLHSHQHHQMTSQSVIKIQRQNGFDSERHPSTFRFDQTNLNDMVVRPQLLTPILDQKHMNTRLIDFGEKPIHYEEQKEEHEQIQRKIFEDQMNSLNEKQLIEGEADIKMHAQVETNVGKLLSELTTKRAIMVMFSVMISIPMLQYETYFSDMTAYDSSLSYLEHTFQNKRINTSEHLSSGAFILGSIARNDQRMSIIYLKVDAQIFVNNTYAVISLRDDEITSYISPSGVAILLMSSKGTSDMNAYLGIIRTTFVIILLIMGAILFSKDANDLVVIPIENMLVKVQRISQNPLQAAFIEEDMAIAEEHLRRQNLQDSTIQDKLQSNNFETAVLEKLIVRTGALLAIGFGDAGSGIIAKNMTDEGEVDPMIPGKKVFAIFGFCSIRHFIELTEILEEKVMVFVNEVAEIVHNTVYANEGSTNKNLGDSFLIVWKFPDDVLTMVDDYPEISNLRIANNFADMALYAFVKILINARKSQNIDEFYKSPKVQERFPNLHLKMGFGLHIGWAIEGAIGSISKIDASYLSPNVNLANRLEEATHHYGIFHLVSGPFYRLLSNSVQAKMRHLDRVTVRGSIQPIDLFTFDVNLEGTPIGVEQRKRIKNRKVHRYFERRRRTRRMELIKQQKFEFNWSYDIDDEINKVQLIYDDIFHSTFHDGLTQYLQGNWPSAKTCFETTKTMLGYTDGPSQTLIEYMREYAFECPEDWRGFRELGEVSR